MRNFFLIIISLIFTTSIYSDNLSDTLLFDNVISNDTNNSQFNDNDTLTINSKDTLIISDDNTDNSYSSWINKIFRGLMGLLSHNFIA